MQSRSKCYFHLAIRCNHIFVFLNVFWSFLMQLLQYEKDNTTNQHVYHWNRCSYTVNRSINVFELWSDNFNAAWKNFICYEKYIYTCPVSKYELPTPSEHGERTDWNLERFWMHFGNKYSWMAKKSKCNVEHREF